MSRITPYNFKGNQISNNIFRYTGVIFCVGYPLAAALGYLIKDWNYMFLACSVCFLFPAVASLFAIESPRFYALKKDHQNVTQSILKLARINGIKIDEVEVANLKDTRNQSLLQQLKDFVQYPVLIIETLIQMLTWFLVAMSYYGFNFGRGSLVPNVYLGYIVAGFSELIAYVLCVAIIHVLG